MNGKVRIAFLALALVLCTLAALSSPASAVVVWCGYYECHIDQDCDAFCQACGYPGESCDTGRYGTYDPGFCECYQPR
ncbi:MAG TPA: hypothetical protein VGG03_21665 [Thermoanaerobaculia bacterium]|jgi:Zn-finger protein